MKILKLYPGKATNPETGEKVDRVRVRFQLPNGLPDEVSVLNSIDELKQAGDTIQEIGNKLIFRENEYGLYARLSRIEATADSIFDQEEVEA